MTSLMPVYNRAPLAFVRGSGSWLYTHDGAAYLDLAAGIATNSLGHAHPKLVTALCEQAQKLWHVSNLFTIPEQEALAQKLTSRSFADTVFFAGSGTEAVECALKCARKFHAADNHPERIDIIGFKGSFHGRTYGAINASGNESYLTGFGPRLPGYIQLSVSDDAALSAAIAAPTTAAIIVEPVQGEGGAHAFAPDWLSQLRARCNASGVLLIYDEVQCGMGRTGRLFAHEWADNAAPDIMTVAKALGGGFPVGACLATRSAAIAMQPGSHGSTFGGNPLAMAVAVAAFDEIAREDTLVHVREISARFFEGLRQIKQRFGEIVEDVRGKGLLIGVKLKTDNRAFMAQARAHHLLLAGGGDNCVRLLPPLTISEEEALEGLARFEAACADTRVSHRA